MIRHLKPALRALAAGSVLLALAGCSSINMFAEGDLMNAEALATANQDTAGAACYSALAGAFSATPTPANDALFTALERKMLVTGALKGPACGPIAAQVLLDATHAVPILGNILGTAGL